MKWDDEHMLTAEKVAYWYFRLNGFFQMENFIVHPDYEKNGQRTEADLLGVRFPRRAERVIGNPEDIMPDDLDRLSLTDETTEIVIVEITENQPCKLNGPWTNKDAQNVERVLAAIGYFEINRLAEIAAPIYEEGQFQENGVRVRLIAIGGQINAELSANFPSVVQLVWPEILEFIGYRLYNYRAAKADNKQWEEQIRLMQEIMKACRKGHDFDVEEFIRRCLKELGFQEG